jgi:hypothetical protein
MIGPDALKNPAMTPYPEQPGIAASAKKVKLGRYTG